MKSLYLAASAIALFSASTAMAAAVVSPTGGGLNARESFSIGGSTPVEGAPGESVWSGSAPPVGPVSVSSQLDFGKTVISTSTAGTYASPTAGSVSFRGSIAQGDPDVPLALRDIYGVADVWGYQFVANTDATFTLTYDLSGGGSQVAGSGVWSLVSVDGFDHEGNQFFNNGFNGFTDTTTSTSGSITLNLVAGNFYSLGLANNDVLTKEGTLTDSANFTWSITPSQSASGAVPEPASWALMILGFGVAGVSMRRRRSLIQA